MNRSTFDKLMRKFEKQLKKTHEIWKGFDALSTQYTMVKGKTNPEAIKKFNKVCEKMQKIQAQIESLWKPYRRIIGICTKCGGTRGPAVMGKKTGLGCFNSDCYYFEVVRKAS